MSLGGMLLYQNNSGASVLTFMEIMLPAWLIKIAPGVMGPVATSGCFAAVTRSAWLTKPSRPLRSIECSLASTEFAAGDAKAGALLRLHGCEVYAPTAAAWSDLVESVAR